MKNLFNKTSIFFLYGIIFFSTTLQADYYEGSKFGYVDNIQINNKSFDDLNDRNIIFYKEDIKNGTIQIKGILEAENKLPINLLHVEISTDGGSSWNKADGNKNWTYKFEAISNKNYQLSLRVVKNQKMLMRNAMADVYAKKILESTKTIEQIINSDRFKKGDVAKFKESLDDIQNILIDTGINIQRGKGLLDNILGDVEIPGTGKTGTAVIDVGDIGSSGADTSGMKGKFTQEALDSWNSMCSDLSYLQHSGNGDLVGRNGMMKMAADDCRKLRESWGDKGSAYYNETATNSQLGSSHKLKDGESLGNYSYKSQVSDDTQDTKTDEEKQSEADADAQAQADAEAQAQADADAQAKAEAEAEAERKRQEEEAKKDNETKDDDDDEESSHRGGGDSPDPVDNEEGGKPMSDEALSHAQKLLGKKNPFSSAAQGGQAGGSGDGRGAEKDDTSNGMMIYTPGTLGSPDDERIQNNSSKVKGGAIKTTTKEQLGGGIKVDEK